MQTLAALIAVLLILALGAVLWYKARSEADAVQEKHADDLAESKKLLEKALAEKELKERQVLDAKVEVIKQAGDLGAALTELARLRGVH